MVLYEALRLGLPFYFSTLSEPQSLSAIRMTLLVALAVVPLNTIFGVCAAWAVTHFRFRGKALLISLIEIPLWVSPVIGGLVFALLFGRQGCWARGSMNTASRSCSPIPGMVLATAFVTFPFVARGLIPLMQSQGNAEEQAALTLGANGWQLFWRVSFPKIKWGVLYGMILCNARAMGEFGAVSILAGSGRRPNDDAAADRAILSVDGPRPAEGVCARVGAAAACPPSRWSSRSRWSGAGSCRPRASSLRLMSVTVHTYLEELREVSGLA